MTTLPPIKIVSASDPGHLATLAADRLLALVGASERPSICLTGGSSPLRLYDLLGHEPYVSKMPWQRIHWFIGDERFVPPDNALNNMGVARRALLDRLAPSENIHPIPTSGIDQADAAKAYENVLQSFYGSGTLDPQCPLFDLVLLGLGSDGHVASLFPGQTAVDKTKRWVVPIAEAGLEPFVPRISLTLPALTSCRELLFQVAGAGKKKIAARALCESSLPAHRARSQGGSTIWMFDREAMPDHAELTSLPHE